MSNKLTIRRIEHYIDDNFTDEKPINLELSVFRLKDGTLIDVGAICYREFSFDKALKGKNAEYLWSTNLASIDRRRLGFVSRLIDALREKSSVAPASKRTYVVQLLAFIGWINTLPFDMDFRDSIHVRRAYEEYTKWLYFRMKLKDGEGLKIKQNYASACQKIARLACSLMVDVSVKTVEYWAMPIRFSERESFSETLTATPLSDGDLFSTYAALCDFIHQVWSLWVKRDVEEVVVNNTVLFSHIDLYVESRKEELYNKTIVAALLSFVGASGANLKVAVDSVLDSFDYGVAGKNTRVSGVKSRAGGKAIYPEFSAKYLSVWKKWLDIRSQWLLGHGFDTDIAFPYRGDGESICAIPGSLTDVTKPAAKLFKQHYGVKWITARYWRGFKSKLLGRASDNDVFASAEMQGHTVKVAIAHYSNRNLADAAHEISTALDAVYESAINRSRKKEHIPIAIVTSNNPDENTVIGVCRSSVELAPAISEGFTEFAPQPDCGVKETCLFCDKYAVHADKRDIKKLLSFCFLVNELACTIPHAEWASRWAPYLHRANEIIDQIKEERPEVEILINQVSEEVEFGDLDEFWLDYYETLSQLGMVAG